MSLFAPLHAVTIAAHTLLAATAGALSPVGGVAAAIVALTLVTRLLLVPLRRRQIRAQVTQASLAPRLRALNERHRGDPQRLVAETTALYRSANSSPTAGCLPALLQAPVLMVLYRMFNDHAIASGPAALPGHAVFGAPLDLGWLAAVGHRAPLASVLVCSGALLGIAALAWWSGRMAARSTPGPLVRLLPFASVLFAAFTPLAIDLYLLTSMAWSAVEEPLLRRRRSAAATG